MFKGRKLDHIGLAVTNLEASKNWYCDVLGFEVIGHFYDGDTPAYFLKNGDTVYEMYQEDLPETLNVLAKEKGYADLEDLAETGFGVSGDTLTDAVRMYNYSYMYFTTLSYYIENDESAVSAFRIADGGYTAEGKTVDFRQLLMVPGGEDWPQVTVAANGTVNGPEEAWAAFRELVAMGFDKQLAK